MTGLNNVCLFLQDSNYYDRHYYLSDITIHDAVSFETLCMLYMFRIKLIKIKHFGLVFRPIMETLSRSVIQSFASSVFNKPKIYIIYISYNH